jgi:hypothetical protein
MRDLNIRKQLLFAFVFAAVLSLFLGLISYYTIRLLNNNLRSTSTELKENVDQELAAMHAQDVVSETANQILYATSSQQLRGINPTERMREISGSGVDKSLETQLGTLHQAKLNYLVTRESLDSSMAAFLEQSDALANLVAQSVAAVRQRTIASAAEKQTEISQKTETGTKNKLAELSHTAGSTLDDTVLVLQLRGKLLEVEVGVDKYLRTSAPDRAKAVTKLLGEIEAGFGKIPENVAGAFEVAEMNTLREKAAKLLTGKDGILSQAAPTPQSIAALDEALGALDAKLMELADNTVFDGSNNLSNYLQQVSGDLSGSLATLINTQKAASASLDNVSVLQQGTASLNETLYKLLFMVQNAALKCTDKCVGELREKGPTLVGQLDEDRKTIVGALNALGESERASEIDSRLSAIVQSAGAKNGVIAQTLLAAKAYNSSLAANSAIEGSLSEASRQSTSLFRNFTDRITNTMQGKVSEGGFWMKVQLWLVVFIFAIAIGLGLWIGASVSKRLSTAVIQLFGLSQKLSASAAALTESSEEQATMASEQAATLEESSSTVEEISSMAQRNNDAVREAADISSDVQGATEESSRKMQSMSKTMDDMNTASAQISKIIRAIDEIAFQTNILALNAAVEAARAGEAGAGFAVVADEVRSLALKCKNAAHETEQIIARNTSLTQEGVKMCSSVAESLETIRERINKLDSLVKEISHSSQEQTMGLGQINQSLATTSDATQKTAAIAQQGASSAQELSREASSLIETIDSLSRLSGSTMGEGQTHIAIGAALPQAREEEEAPAHALDAPATTSSARKITRGGTSGHFLPQ